MVEIKEKLDYLSFTGNHLVVNVMSAPFEKIEKKQKALRKSLKRIPEIFGEDAPGLIRDINSISYSSITPIDRAAFHILNIAIQVSKAKSYLDINSAEEYSDSYWDNLWTAVEDEGIEYEDPIF